MESISERSQSRLERSRRLTRKTNINPRSSSLSAPKDLPITKLGSQNLRIPEWARIIFSNEIEKEFIFNLGQKIEKKDESKTNAVPARRVVLYQKEEIVSYCGSSSMNSTEDKKSTPSSSSCTNSQLSIIEIEIFPHRMGLSVAREILDSVENGSATSLEFESDVEVVYNALLEKLTEYNACIDPCYVKSTIKKILNYEGKLSKNSIGNFFSDRREEATCQSFAARSVDICVEILQGFVQF